MLLNGLVILSSVAQNNLQYVILAVWFFHVDIAAHSQYYL